MKAGGLVFLRLGHLFLNRLDLWNHGESANNMYSHAGNSYLVCRGRHLECALYTICPQQVLTGKHSRDSGGMSNDAQSQFSGVQYLRPK